MPGTKRHRRRPHRHPHTKRPVCFGVDLLGQQPDDAIADVDGLALLRDVAQAHEDVGVGYVKQIHSSALSGPITVTSRGSGSVLSVTTSGRCSRAFWSLAPALTMLRPRPRPATE